MKRVIALFASLAFTAGLMLTGSPPAAAAMNTYTAHPLATNEVPSSASGYSGSVTITIDTTTFEVCVHATLNTGEETVTANHIHTGAAGVNGAIVVNFAAVTDGCVTSTSDVVNAIVADPSAFYYNAHTAMFPGGALRDQLSLQQVATTTTAAPTTSAAVAPAVAAQPAFTG